jgi:hypothetical protein
MSDDTQIDFSATDELGHPIRGSYRVVGEIIRVKLSDGTTGEASLGSTPAPTVAKMILHELHRERRVRGRAA